MFVMIKGGTLTGRAANRMLLLFADGQAEVSISRIWFIGRL